MLRHVSAADNVWGRAPLLGRNSSHAGLSSPRDLPLYRLPSSPNVSGSDSTSKSFAIEGSFVRCTRGKFSELRIGQEIFRIRDALQKRRRFWESAQKRIPLKGLWEKLLRRRLTLGRWQRQDQRGGKEGNWSEIQNVNPNISLFLFNGKFPHIRVNCSWN